MPPNPTEVLKRQYWIAEFKTLRREIEIRSQEQRQMERYVLIGDAAIYSFLVSQQKGSLATKSETAKPDQTFLRPDPILEGIAWYLPPLLALLALVRWAASNGMIAHIARYLQTRERDFVGEKGGWECHLSETRRRSGREVSMVSWWYFVFWTVLVAAPSALAWYQHPLLSTGYKYDWAALAFIFGVITASIVGGPWVKYVRGKRGKGQTLAVDASGKPSS